MGYSVKSIPPFFVYRMYRKDEEFYNSPSSVELKIGLLSLHSCFSL